MRNGNITIKQHDTKRDKRRFTRRAPARKRPALVFRLCCEYVIKCAVIHRREKFAAVYVHASASAGAGLAAVYADIYLGVGDCCLCRCRCFVVCVAALFALSCEVKRIIAPSSALMRAIAFPSTKSSVFFFLGSDCELCGVAFLYGALYSRPRYAEALRQ